MPARDKIPGSCLAKRIRKTGGWQLVTKVILTQEHIREMRSSQIPHVQPDALKIHAEDTVLTARRGPGSPGTWKEEAGTPGNNDIRDRSRKHTAMQKRRQSTECAVLRLLDDGDSSEVTTPH